MLEGWVPAFIEPAWLYALLLLLIPVVLLARRTSGCGSGRTRLLASTAARCAALGLVAIALAGPLDDTYTSRLDVMYVLDVSRSVGPQAEARALRFFNQAVSDGDPSVRAGLLVFGADAAVDVLLSHSAQPVTEVAADVPREGTDIARALEVAMGAFPAGAQRRIVLLSDGRETTGRARAAAATARAIGVELYTIALSRPASDTEVYVQNLTTPDWVRVHEPFELKTYVHSTSKTNAHVAITRNGEIVRELQVALVPGENVLKVVEQTAEPGLFEYEAIINTERDGILENNRYQSFVRVTGAPKVLHAIGAGVAAENLAVVEALRAQGLVVDVLPATAMPAQLHQLTDYDLIILDNVSGLDLSQSKMDALDEYVRGAGGGLINLGGDRSYSAGGYYGSPIERLLPVAMDVRTEVKIPSVAVAILLDRSGSMQGDGKLDIAKSAAMSAVEVLNPLDKVGVLAFDARFEWTVPLTEAGNRRQIAQKLRPLNATGGTNLFPALHEAHTVMAAAKAKIKHLIILSDGLTSTGEDFEQMGERIAADGITVSTVALGKDADQTLMAMIAKVGRGRFYYTDDARHIPRIFTSETMIVSRDLLVETPTQARLGHPGEMLDGFAEEAFPSLAGYQRTFPKPAAQVLLRAADDDPLLVSWRYGLGKSVAFMSDLSGRWGKEWVVWPEFGRFAAQMARWTMRRSGSEQLLPRFTFNGDDAQVMVDALDHDDRFINGLTLDATLVTPGKERIAVSMQQIAPGRYGASFALKGPGRYYLNVSGEGAGVRIEPQTFGMAVPYSAEYIDAGVDHELLADLATSTGGLMLPLTNASLAQINAGKPGATAERSRVWQPLVLAALLLLLADIAVRKIRAPQWLKLPWRTPQPALSAEPVDTQEYTSLAARIEANREQHLNNLRANRDYIPEEQHDPAARARLYLASARKSR